MIKTIQTLFTVYSAVLLDSKVLLDVVTDLSWFGDFPHQALILCGTYYFGMGDAFFGIDGLYKSIPTAVWACRIGGFSAMALALSIPLEDKLAQLKKQSQLAHTNVVIEKAPASSHATDAEIGLSSAVESFFDLF